jgi:hypothetical protein
MYVVHEHPETPGGGVLCGWVPHIVQPAVATSEAQVNANINAMAITTIFMSPPIE